MTLRKVGRAFIRALVIAGTAVGVLSLLSYIFYPKNNQDGFGMIDSSANGIMGERSQSIDALFIVWIARPQERRLVLFVERRVREVSEVRGMRPNRVVPTSSVGATKRSPPPFFACVGARLEGRGRRFARRAGDLVPNGLWRGGPTRPSVPERR